MLVRRSFLGLTLSLGLLATTAVSQQRPAAQPAQPVDPVQDHLRALEESLGFLEQRLTKRIDDLMWFRAMEDIASIDKVRYTGPPPRVISNPTGQGAGNPVSAEEDRVFSEAPVDRDCSWGCSQFFRVKLGAHRA